MLLLPPSVSLRRQSTPVLVHGREEASAGVKRGHDRLCLVVHHVEGSLVALKVEGGLAEEGASHQTAPGAGSAAGGDLRVDAAVAVGQEVVHDGQGFGAE